MWWGEVGIKEGREKEKERRKMEGREWRKGKGKLRSCASIEVFKSRRLWNCHGFSEITKINTYSVQ